eukprot:TRINITY_DN11227_c0_g1_i1.p1 TRINITY_DN11227_c0_g1~~TRINITY_DN11227_c0_g1_i1.p1  ORF type:complete len:219 (-),score=10.33 TRINITY_DN11227_c0_g1_i1:138-794(-)
MCIRDRGRGVVNLLLRIDFIILKKMQTPVAQQRPTKLIRIDLTKYVPSRRRSSHSNNQHDGIVNHTVQNIAVRGDIESNSSLYNQEAFSRLLELTSEQSLVESIRPPSFLPAPISSQKIVIKQPLTPTPQPRGARKLESLETSVSNHPEKSSEKTTLVDTGFNKFQNRLTNLVIPSLEGSTLLRTTRTPKPFSNVSSRFLPPHSANLNFRRSPSPSIV